MMEFLLSAVWSLLELVFFYIFWNSFLKPKQPFKIQIVALCIAWVISLIYTSMDLDPTPKQLTSLCMLYFTIRLCFSGTWFHHLLILFLGYALGGIVDTAIMYGITFSLGVSLADFVWKFFSYIVTVTIGKLTSILLSWIVYCLRKSRSSFPIRREWLFLTLLFPVTSLGMLAVVFISHQDESDLSLGAFIFSMILFVANIAMLYLIHIMERNSKKSEEMVLLKQQMEIQTDSIIALERNYRTQRQATHEFKNQLQTIHDLLCTKEYDAAFEYVQQLQATQTTRIFTINCHHPIMDAVLNHKYQTAKEYNIDMQVQVNDLSRVNLPTNILVVLFSNLLDNAIEACNRLKNDSIIQCSVIDSDSLFISVRNTSLPVEIRNNTISTNKDCKEAHGYGLSQIKHILSDLDAEYTFAYEDGWFQFVAEIPNVNS